MRLVTLAWTVTKRIVWGRELKDRFMKSAVAHLNMLLERWNCTQIIGRNISILPYKYYLCKPNITAVTHCEAGHIGRGFVFQHFLIIFGTMSNFFKVRGNKSVPLVLTSYITSLACKIWDFMLYSKRCITLLPDYALLTICLYSTFWQGGHKDFKFGPVW